jgi:hypothetical protein
VIGAAGDQHHQVCDSGAGAKGVEHAGALIVAAQ